MDPPLPSQNPTWTILTEGRASAMNGYSRVLCPFECFHTLVDILQKEMHIDLQLTTLMYTFRSKPVWILCLFVQVEMGNAGGSSHLKFRFERLLQLFPLYESVHKIPITIPYRSVLEETVFVFLKLIMLLYKSEPFAHKFTNFKTSYGDTKGRVPAIF